MKTYTDELITERSLLISHLNQCNAFLKNVPKERLWVTHCGKYLQFYTIDPASHKRRYISTKELVYIRNLAQRDYNQQMRLVLKRRIRAIDAFLKEEQQADIYMVYHQLPDARKKLVIPIEQDDKQFVKQWISESFTAKPFREEDTTGYFTARGERVRSKSEVIIADTLKELGIPYRYECPLELEFGVMIHPDFTILRISDRKVLYLEHLGRMDDPGYSESAISRILLFGRNGIFQGDRLFLTFETAQRPLDRRMLKEMLVRNFL